MLETCWCILQYVHIIKGETLLEQIYLEICFCVCSKIWKMLPIYSEICYVFCTCYGRACASGGRYQTVTNSNFKQSCIIPISSNLACLDNKSFLCHSSVFLFSPLYIQDTGDIYIYIIIHLIRSLLRSLLCQQGNGHKTKGVNLPT